MPATLQPKPKRTAVKRQAVVQPAPRPRTGRPKPTRSRRGIFLPGAVIFAIIATHLTSLAMLHYENARLVQLRRETDRVKLNIEKLRGQIAVYTDEIAINRWAEQAGMVRVETQPELTIIGLDAPTMPTAPVAMRPTE
ncbi:MAG: hypothetical protein CFK49_07855 [Armatimonadetes bacterium JP3_11]|nr:MAG: hypothetical protein CFK49_07855 [Armatimonadetes bacterium JP3_11]RMH06215.1 MAG: hypothetical protein D6697_11060 [Armatimonadota bacterium]